MVTTTPPIAAADPYAALTAAEVGAILGTPVSAAERAGATCSFATTSTTAVGNHDPALPTPNAALHDVAITVPRGTADALAGGRAHFVFKPEPLTIPGADLAFVMGGPHVAVVFAQRGDEALEVVVLRGRTEDAYLAGQLAGAILPGLPAA